VCAAYDHAGRGLATLGCIRPSATANGAVALALRLEVISLQDTSAGTNRLEGTVESVEFLGSTIRVEVKLRARTLHLDMLNKPGLTLPPQGSPTAVYFAPEACLLLNE
jgi:putative spermidine/putrescine transport system ATP-binding protein